MSSTEEKLLDYVVAHLDQNGDVGEKVLKNSDGTWEIAVTLPGSVNDITMDALMRRSEIQDLTFRCDGMSLMVRVCKTFDREHGVRFASELEERSRVVDTSKSFEDLGNTVDVSNARTMHDFFVHKLPSDVDSIRFVRVGDDRFRGSVRLQPNATVSVSDLRVVRMCQNLVGYSLSVENARHDPTQRQRPQTRKLKRSYDESIFDWRLLVTVEIRLINSRD